MPLSADALCTVDEAQSYLGDPGADTTVLELVVNGKSRAIQRYCRREFCPKTAAEARSFSYDGSGILSLSPYELRAATTITVNGSEIQTTGYRVEPRGKTPEGTYLWLLLPAYGPGRSTPSIAVDLPPTEFGHEVIVTGDWGAFDDHTDVPGDVKLACLIAVAQGWRNPEGFQGRSLGELDIAVGAADFDNSSLPLAARQLLSPYRRSPIH